MMELLRGHRCQSEVISANLGRCGCFGGCAYVGKQSLHKRQALSVAAAVPPLPWPPCRPPPSPLSAAAAAAALAAACASACAFIAAANFT
jgi:hypothetical protein